MLSVTSSAVCRPSTAKLPAAAAIVFTGASLIDIESFTFEIFAVHTFDGRIGLRYGGHLDKTEAS